MKEKEKKEIMNILKKYENKTSICKNDFMKAVSNTGISKNNYKGIYKIVVTVTKGNKLK